MKVDSLFGARNLADFGPGTLILGGTADSSVYGITVGSSSRTEGWLVLEGANAGAWERVSSIIFPVVGGGTLELPKQSNRWVGTRSNSALSVATNGVEAWFVFLNESGEMCYVDVATGEWSRKPDLLRYALNWAVRADGVEIPLVQFGEPEE